ncbi:DUF4153 domain-containing protein [Rhodovulum adriaticum]|uniref:Uncharacterized protein DUF4153 n=1 Tax=Rhodovulum adriaticum TaxID=35804 RepID=A0A4R2NWI6_RHOAD|nr:DUF4153 domain-containing protein [Rhodovulum adriaticum]MBK1636385.1 hypothetical protein [Rhodovulum adriaticum]TCP26440.1 uncharacterized protein DUF4153 [Rhodovulum adriaticum]
MDDTTRTTLTGRIALGLTGLLAGVAMWLLVEVLPEAMVDQPRNYLFLTALAAAFFPAALALTGPLPLPRAPAAAFLLAAPLAALLSWASLRFDTVAGFLDTGHPQAAFALLAFLPLPFLIAGLGPRGRWGDYKTLFIQSWMIVVRFAAAWLFVGLVWGVLFLSNALLELVGIGVIEWLIERQEAPYLLSGLTLGVALAVVGELSDYVSPYLVLRLLRLLMPVVLLVVAVFLAALPFQGLSNLFGDFSATAILSAMAIGAATLISVTLDAEDSRRTPGGALCWACRAMALLLPALAALAGLALWQRVAQYGLSPDRIAAAAVVAVLLGYGLAYAASVLGGRGWAGRIRRANVAMAVVAMGVAAAFLTPLLNPQAIAAADQVARYRDGTTSAGALDLWSLAREWGRPGQAATERLAAMRDHPEAETMARRLAALDEAPNRYAFERESGPDDAAALKADLATRLPVRPKGATLPPGLLDSLRLWELQQISRACANRTAAGNPGCVAVLADLSGTRAGDEVLIVAHNTAGAPLVRAYFRNQNGAGFAMRSPDYLQGGDFYREADTAIDALIAGAYTLRPMPLNALDVAGRQLFFGR